MTSKSSLSFLALVVFSRIKRLRRGGAAVILLLLSMGAQSAVWADCGTCQVCRTRERITIPADFCDVADEENGSMCCSQQAIGIGTYCTESGSACYGIIVGGGGGGTGGGGGGGGGCTYQNGWCPAECWSCGGTKY